MMSTHRHRHIAPQKQTRDRDLLTVDSVLTDEALDNLWNWYSEATENNVDPQMIFVKFVNSVMNIS